MNISGTTKYLIGEQANIQLEECLIFPELHKTKEDLILCECPDFNYNGDKVKQLCQAISLELALNMAKKIHGVIIVLDYSDFYVCRGSNYRNIIERLGHLFGSNFDTIFKSSIFLMVNKPEETSIEDIKNVILKSKKENIEFLQNELLSIDDDYKEQDEVCKQAKMEIIFTQLFISHEKQIFILDTSDKGNGRSSIISALTQVSPIECIR